MCGEGQKILYLQFDENHKAAIFISLGLSKATFVIKRFVIESTWSDDINL